VLERCVEALELAHVAALDGNPNSVSDAGVAAACAVAAAEGASLNVRINLDGLDVDVSGIVDRQDAALARSRELGAAVLRLVDEQLE
jgi:glutamate formiminotransferase/formiminotetrahydrofolate cyclodeaminase